MMCSGSSRSPECSRHFPPSDCVIFQFWPVYRVGLLWRPKTRDQALLGGQLIGN